jgi:hypothetical protein
MPFLNLDGGSGSSDIVERLVLERKRCKAKSIGFDAVEVDEAILQAAVVLFRDRQQQIQQQQQQQQRSFSIDSSRKNTSNNNKKIIQKQKSNNSNNNDNKNNSNSNNNNNITLEKLCINNCPVNPYLEYLIEAAMGMDLFSELELQGNIDEEKEQETTDETNNNNNTNSNSNSNSNNNVFALDALGFRMRFSRRLRKLELINLPMTRDHAESLMYGIETNTSTGTGCRLDTLFMENVRFDDGDNDNGNNDDGEEEEEEEEEEDEDEDEDEDNDGAAFNNANNNNNNNSPRKDDAGTVVIQELCEGFPNNRTLKTIELQRCRLTDSQIALIFDSLSYHPTLTSLNLSENFCRKLGLEALDRMLTSSPPPPQQHQQSNGGNSTDDKNSNSNIKEKNDTSGDDHRQQHKHKQKHCRLESLDLSYQFINTSEETYGMTGRGGEEEDEERIQLNILTRNCTTRDVCYKIYPNLRKLVLCGNQIDDSDMKDLAFLIRHRFPRLEEIDLRYNDITTDGLQTFADYSDPNNDNNFFTTNNNNNKTNTTKNGRKTQFTDHFPPPSSRLRIIRLTNNPLVMTNQTSIILLKLLKIYPELQLIQSNLEWENGTSMAMYIQHLLDINRAGRVLLLAGSSGNVSTSSSSSTSSDTTSTAAAATSVDSSTKSKQQCSPEEGRRRKQQHNHQRRPIPLSAWPLVLARLTRKARYPHYIPKKNTFNGMFYLIRHGPIIVEQMSSRKKTSSNEDQDQNDRRRPKRKWGDPALGGYETLEDFLRCELGVKS